MATSKKIKIIYLLPKVKKEIAAELGCSLDTVYRALRLSKPTEGEQPDRIRQMAMARGGYVGTKPARVKEIKM